MTLTERLRAIGDGFSALGIPCQHYWRPVKDAPMLIWAENGADNFHADGNPEEQAITGTLDYFTKVEFDNSIDAIQSHLFQYMSGFSLESIQYEEETNLIHVEWSWVYIG